MKHNDPLSDIFARFAGRAVKVREENAVMHFKALGTIRIYECKLAEDDTTIKDLKAETEKAGFSLRVLLPGTVGTMEYREDRVNAVVAKDGDGVFRVKSLDIG